MLGCGLTLHRFCYSFANWFFSKVLLINKQSSIPKFLQLWILVNEINQHVARIVLLFVSLSRRDSSLFSDGN